MFLDNTFKKMIRGIYDKCVVPDLWRDKTVLFSGGANDALAQRIASQLEMELHPLGGFFLDSDPDVEFEPSVRGKHAIVIQSTTLSDGHPADKPLVINERKFSDNRLSKGRSANDNLVFLLASINAIALASAHEITAVIPYFGGSRQDRKVTAHVPILASLYAGLLHYAGADRVVFVDLHSGQIQGMFPPRFKVDNLYAMPILVDKALVYLEGEGFSREKITLGAPDVGVKVLRSLAAIYGLPIVQIDKEKLFTEAERAEAIFGEVKDRAIILLDDMFSTFKTMFNAIGAILELEAKIVIPCAIHPIIVGPCIDLMNKSEVPLILTTDSIALRKENHLPDKLKVVSIAPMLAEVTKEIVIHGSVSKHFRSIRD